MAIQFIFRQIFEEYIYGIKFESHSNAIFVFVYVCVYVQFIFDVTLQKPVK